MMKYSDNLNLAIGAAINAGCEIMKIYESDDFGVETKGDDSPLTKADKASHSRYLRGPCFFRPTVTL